MELIDDFRVRLLQLLHAEYEDPLASLMPRILNTIHYVSSVLVDWGVTVVRKKKKKKLTALFSICMVFMEFLKKWVMEKLS